LCLKDVDQYELEVAQPALVMRYEGMELLPLKTSAGLVFIQEKYLSPLDELEYMRLFERRSGGGGVYIVAKVGMLLQAVILPVDVVCDRLVYQLGELTELCRDAMVENNLSAWKEDQNDPETGRQRSLFQVDEETGEVVEE
jgi:hypothetical protein